MFYLKVNMKKRNPFFKLKHFPWPENDAYQIWDILIKWIGHLYWADKRVSVIHIYRPLRSGRISHKVDF